MGVSGDTTTDLIKRFQNEVKARWPQSNELALVFSIGTNNAYVGNDGSESSQPDKYRYELIDLVEKARRFTDKIMFVGLTPCDDKRTNPVFWAPINYKTDRIKLFEDVAREFCREQGIPHVAVYETFMDKAAMGIDLFADGLHPNDLGHQLIYETVLPELDKLLAGDGGHQLNFPKQL